MSVYGGELLSRLDHGCVGALNNHCEREGFDWWGHMTEDVLMRHAQTHRDALAPMVAALGERCEHGVEKRRVGRDAGRDSRVAE
eukprot:scaffold171044_cov30-Tisochrysis_lutea.AAC.6